jgi:hypothetical protein
LLSFTFFFSLSFHFLQNIPQPFNFYKQVHNHSPQTDKHEHRQTYCSSRYLTNLSLSPSNSTNIILIAPIATINHTFDAAAIHLTDRPSTWANTFITDKYEICLARRAVIRRCAAAALKDTASYAGVVDESLGRVAFTGIVWGQREGKCADGALP